MKTAPVKPADRVRGRGAAMRLSNPRELGASAIERYVRILGEWKAELPAAVGRLTDHVRAGASATRAALANRKALVVSDLRERIAGSRLRRRLSNAPETLLASIRLPGAESLRHVLNLLPERDKFRDGGREILDEEIGEVLAKLYRQVERHRAAKPEASRTARLFQAGRKRIVTKVGEEAIEAGIAAVAGGHEETVRESADLLYNLVVLWVEFGVGIDEVVAEMRERERIAGLAEKRPKDREDE